MNWYKQKQEQSEELSALFEEKGEVERSQYYALEAQNYKKMAEEYS